MENRRSGDRRQGGVISGECLKRQARQADWAARQTQWQNEPETLTLDMLVTLLGDAAQAMGQPITLDIAGTTHRD
jgi:hypothetical protein